MSLKKRDKVKILKGKDKGKFGKILRIFNKKNKISVEGVNLVFKNVKAKRQNEKGQK
ncbi:KOW motif-containing protein, partial [Candidatus Falkowbacteria bacterium]|nr:KOW motif-containing protein [Candidatus Falkowbacteria bacterium]